MEDIGGGESKSLNNYIPPKVTWADIVTGTKH